MLSNLLIISGPSCVGKTAIREAMLQSWPDLQWSVSATTRSSRLAEQQGLDYDYISKVEFQERINHDYFLEWVHNAIGSYGTPRLPVMDAISTGKSMLMDTDPTGMIAIRTQLQAVARVRSVFLLPISMAALEERLRARSESAGTPASELALRMQTLHVYLQWAYQYDLVLVNQCPTEAADCLQRWVNNEMAASEIPEAVNPREWVQRELPGSLPHLSRVWTEGTPADLPLRQYVDLHL